MRGTQIDRFGTTPRGHLGDQFADQSGGSLRLFGLRLGDAR